MAPTRAGPGLLNIYFLFLHPCLPMCDYSISFDFVARIKLFGNWGCSQDLKLSFTGAYTRAECKTVPLRWSKEEILWWKIAMEMLPMQNTALLEWKEELFQTLSFKWVKIAWFSCWLLKIEIICNVCFWAQNVLKWGQKNLRNRYFQKQNSWVLILEISRLNVRTE